MAVISCIRINTLRSCFVNLGYSLELNKAAQQSVVNPIANLKKRTQDTALASKLAQVSSCDRRIGRKDSMEGLADGLVLDSKIGIPNWTLRLQLSTSMSTQKNSPILGGSQCACRPPPAFLTVSWEIFRRSVLRYARSLLQRVVDRCLHEHCPLG